MKLLIVGLGSMGKRRARLAKGMDATVEIVGEIGRASCRERV